jgi:hypothetical protein
MIKRVKDAVWTDINHIEKNEVYNNIDNRNIIANELREIAGKFNRSELPYFLKCAVISNDKSYIKNAIAKRPNYTIEKEDYTICIVLGQNFNSCFRTAFLCLYIKDYIFTYYNYKYPVTNYIFQK